MFRIWTATAERLTRWYAMEWARWLAKLNEAIGGGAARAVNDVAKVKTGLSVAADACKFGIVHRELCNAITDAGRPLESPVHTNDTIRGVGKCEGKWLRVYEQLVEGSR